MIYLSKKYRLIVFFAVAAVVAAAVYLINNDNAALVDGGPAKELPSADFKNTEITAVSVGDIFLHTNNLSAAYDSATKTYGFDPVFSEVAGYFKNADLATAWLGGVMDSAGPYTGYPIFRSPESLVSALENIGLDAVFKTNHSMDGGTKGLNTTTEILDKHNIGQIAAYTTEESSKKFYIYQKGDLKVAYLGYIYGMNGLPIPEPWMINLIDLNKIQNDILAAKKQSDFVVVALHFGNEYQRYPSGWQKETAQKVADFGADMIIGSHPHVIQPTDLITAADGRQVYVAYSLGNFYCGQRERYTDTGMILKYTIEKSNGAAKLKKIGYIPTWVAEYRESGKLRYKILPDKKFVSLYDQGQAPFLSASNYFRLQQAYRETVEHLDNPGIGFAEAAD